jgi:PBSX family phage terminase large subunit
MIEKNLQLDHHPFQERVMLETKRFIVCVSGIRGGKTTIGALWLLSRIQKDRMEGKSGDYLICAPTAKILQQATLPKFREYFPADWGVWREQKSCFELNWFRDQSQEPCRIFVRSMDDPESIEGMEVLAAWADELGKMKSSSWTMITGRLSVTQGPCIITTTPYASGWFYRDVFKKALENDKNYAAITWSSIDNPVFPKEEFERARRELPKALFERRYLGKFTRLEGLVYPEFDEDLHTVEPFPIPEDWFQFGGMDFGFNNPNAILPIAEDPVKHIYYVYAEFYQNETLLQTLADYLKSKPLAYVLADTQSAQLIAELQNYYGCRNIKEADKAIEVGIQRIRTLLQEERLKFFRGKTDKTVEEILQYHYPQNTDDKATTDKPVPTKNHAMDALRYAFSRPLQGLYFKRPKRKFDLGQRRALRQQDADPYTGY